MYITFKLIENSKDPVKMNELDPGGESLNFLAHNFEKQKKLEHFDF